MQLTKTIPVTDASVWSCAARESSSSSSMAKSVADAAADAAVASSFEASSCRLYIHVHVRCTLHSTKQKRGAEAEVHEYTRIFGTQRLAVSAKHFQVTRVVGPFASQMIAKGKGRGEGRDGRKKKRKTQLLYRSPFRFLALLLSRSRALCEYVQNVVNAGTSWYFLRDCCSSLFF